MPDNFQPYSPDDLQDFENKGWMQMQEMLNKHLPEETPVRKTGIAPVWKWLAAACIVIGVAIPLIIRLYDKSIPAQNRQTATLATPGSAPNNSVVEAGKKDTASISDHPIVQHDGLNTKGKDTEITSGISIPSDAVNKQTSFTGKQKNNEIVPSQAVGYAHHFDSSKLQAVATKPTNTLPAGTSDPKKDSNHQVIVVQNTKPSSEQKAPQPEKPYWPEEEHEDNNTKRRNKVKAFNLALLLNRNTNAQQHTGNNLYDMPAYPSVTASVRISNSIGITTGLTANAPGNFNLSPKEGAMAMSLADPMANAKYSALMYTSASATYLTQAYYWQVPLTFDYFPVKNVKLYAGANLAFVQKVLLTEQTTTVNAGAISPAITTTNVPVLRSNSTYEASVNDNGVSYTLKQFDPRMTVGGFYQIKNLMLGVQYSRAIQPSLMQRSAAIPNSNNSVVNFSIGVKLFDKHK